MSNRAFDVKTTGIFDSIILKRVLFWFILMMPALRVIIFLFEEIRLLPIFSIRLYNLISNASVFVTYSLTQVPVLINTLKHNFLHVYSKPLEIPAVMLSTSLSTLYNFFLIVSFSVWYLLSTFFVWFFSYSLLCLILAVSLTCLAISYDWASKVTVARKFYRRVSAIIFSILFGYIFSCIIIYIFFHEKDSNLRLSEHGGLNAIVVFCGIFTTIKISRDYINQGRNNIRLLPIKTDILSELQYIFSTSLLSAISDTTYSVAVMLFATFVLNYIPIHISYFWYHNSIFFSSALICPEKLGYWEFFSFSPIYLYHYFAEAPISFGGTFFCSSITAPFVSIILTVSSYVLKVR